jgi:L-alanine-DL-glutamate epimerase and related enzymes of enolase superfamily
MIRISHADLNFEREPLAAPWGFKGGFLTGLWQTVVLLQSEAGSSGRRNTGLGLGTQSVLWCDPRVFAACSEAGGNAAMFQLTEHAARIARTTEFDSPMELLNAVLPDTQEYARTLTGLRDLKEVFALNALVPLDNAAWMLWAAENEIDSFDALIPADARPALAHKQSSVISVPAVGYGLPLAEIAPLVAAGFFVLKIKLGSDPDKDGDQEKMLRWDIARMGEIHRAVGSAAAPGPPSGCPLYYLDANGRYDSKERVWRLIDALDATGALGQTILLEEPFPEESQDSVADIPIRVVADESASNVEETKKRIALGYGAVALKPIAKTLSMTFRIAKLCHELGVPAFCADLTVNPILVDWNKNVAARLPAIPGLDAGLQETNGFQNYRDWERLISYHPAANGSWLQANGGRFQVDGSFYERSGGILTPSSHYSGLVRVI